MTQTIKHPDHWALVIAIEKYRYFDPLNSPGASATRFSQALIKQMGVPPEQIVLVDAANEDGQPKMERLFEGFRKLGVRMGVRQGSRLYLYYSGHGLGTSFLDAVIVPADVRHGELEEACLSIGNCVQFMLDTGLFDEVAVFMDCCRETIKVAPKRLPFQADKKFTGANLPVNHFILFGTSDGGQAWDVRNPAAGGSGGGMNRDYRGIMTEALIEALEGAPAAFDHDNRVTTASLAQFIRTRVALESKSRSLRQAVQPILSGLDEMVFLTADQPPLMKVHLRIGPQTASLKVVLRNTLTGQEESQVAGAEGTVLDFTIAGNTRHRIIVGETTLPQALDPIKLGREGNAELP